MRRGRTLLLWGLAVVLLVVAAALLGLALRPPPGGGKLGHLCYSDAQCPLPLRCVDQPGAGRVCAYPPPCPPVPFPGSGRGSGAPGRRSGPPLRVRISSPALGGRLVGARRRGAPTPDGEWAELLDPDALAEGDRTEFWAVPGSAPELFFLGLEAGAGPGGAGGLHYLTRRDENPRLWLGRLAPDPATNPEGASPDEEKAAGWTLLEGGGLADPARSALLAAKDCPLGGDRPPVCAVPGVSDPPQPLARGVPYRAAFSEKACEAGGAYAWSVTPHTAGG